MPQLVVRNIEEFVVRRLRAKAAKAGISMEEEHRQILRKALIGRNKNGQTFGEMLLSIPQASKNEPENLFARQKDLARETNL